MTLTSQRGRPTYFWAPGLWFCFCCGFCVGEGACLLLSPGPLCGGSLSQTSNVGCSPALLA